MRLTPSQQRYADAVAAGDEAGIDRFGAALDAEHAQREARLNAPDALGEAAAWYAASGVAVFPCVPGRKAPITRRGFKDATTDAAQVRDWWAAMPDANVALPTGRRFDVIDVDGPEGTIALGEVKDAGGMPEILAWARTPHGFHYLVPPAGYGNKTGFLTQVDYRGAGGYVVAPPSRTADGVYRWVHGYELDPSRLPQEVAA